MFQPRTGSSSAAVLLIYKYFGQNVWQNLVFLPDFFICLVKLEPDYVAKFFQARPEPEELDPPLALCTPTKDKKERKD
jgi:hypothetical protein